MNNTIPTVKEIKPCSSIDKCHFFLVSFCSVKTKTPPNEEIIKEKNMKRMYVLKRYNIITITCNQIKI